VKKHSRKYSILKNWKKKIIQRYNDLEWGSRPNKLAAVIKLLKQTDRLADSGLKTLQENNLISKNEKEEIKSYRRIKSIEEIDTDAKFYDLKVNNNHNLFAGNFGLVLSHNCGVGTDISHLRPRGTVVRNASQTSTGAASFMERFSESTREVAQEGRRGALMLTIDIRHPDSEEFIDKKMDETSVTGANISVRLRDEFMEAVKTEETFVQRWPVDETPENAEVVNEIDAERLWHKIVSNAHESAEPGLMFWDNILRENPANVYENYRSESTNPCGEVDLPPEDSCRLTAMNLFGFVKNPFTEDAYFDFEEFSEAVQVGQRIMDDVVDLEIEQVEKIINKVENDPEPEHIKRIEIDLWKKIREKAKTGRRTGLGVTAL